MTQEKPSCDLCLGTQHEPYRASGPHGRRLLRCRACGLVAAAPPWRPGAAASRDPRADARRAAALMRLLPSGGILEIGCGPGGVLGELDSLRYEAVGLEVDPELAEEAARRLRETGLRGGVVIASPVEARLPAEAFDLVAVFGALERSPSPRALLSETARVLKPGGRVVVETPSLSSLTARLHRGRWRPLRDPSVGHFFTHATLTRMARLCGLVGSDVLAALPSAWPPPGTLVYVARKSAVACHARDASPELLPMQGPAGKMAAAGAAD